MKKIITFTIFTTMYLFSFGQKDSLNFHEKSVEERVQYVYSGILYDKCEFDCFDEIAFMNSQIHPSIRTLFLWKLPIIVADSIKQLNDGEHSEPIYVDGNCYIVKRIKKGIFRYKLNIIYLDNNRSDIFYDLPKRR
jgi:hypothetical protein